MIVSSLFDSWYGFIFWGFAYFEIHRGQWFRGLSRTLESILNVVVLVVGFTFLGAGTYVSVQSIINSYADGNISESLSACSSVSREKKLTTILTEQPFRCTNNGF